MENRRSREYVLELRARLGPQGAEHPEGEVLHRRPTATMSHMAKVPVREFRNDIARVLDRVISGERIVVTVRGRSVAQVTRLENDRQWMSRDEFIRTISRLRPDDALAEDVRASDPNADD